MECTFHKHTIIWISIIIGCLLNTACFELFTTKKNIISYNTIHPNAPTKPAINFNKAKLLAKLIHAKHNTTFYCNCLYNYQNNKIDLRSCGYQWQHDTSRAHSIEWEHIVPASTFGKNLPCWHKKLCRTKSNRYYKGRACCQKIDPNFAKIEADLHNIVPIIGELNAIRSNYSFAELPYITNVKQFGSCNIKFDKKNRLIEPRAEIKGMIARTYLYMADVYKLPLTSKQKKLFLNWDQQDPPSAWEITWNKQVAIIQGNDNTYISTRIDQKN